MAGPSNPVLKTGVAGFQGVFHLPATPVAPDEQNVPHGNLRRHRVLVNHAGRAFAGLSIGGQTIWNGFNNSGKFDWVLACSPAVPPLADLPADRARKLRLLRVGIGRDDFLLRNDQQFDTWLPEQKIPHTRRVTGGSHSWRVCRRYLTELTPLLFR